MGERLDEDYFNSELLGYHYLQSGALAGTPPRQYMNLVAVHEIHNASSHRFLPGGALGNLLDRIVYADISAGLLSQYFLIYQEAPGGHIMSQPCHFPSYINCTRVGFIQFCHVVVFEIFFYYSMPPAPPLNLIPSVLNPSLRGEVIAATFVAVVRDQSVVSLLPHMPNRLPRPLHRWIGP